MTLYEDEDE